MKLQVSDGETKAQVDHLLSEKQAALIVGCSPASLKQSRHSGVLFGVPAPPFLKMGRSARYRVSSLLHFVMQFTEYRNTSEINDETR